VGIDLHVNAGGDAGASGTFQGRLELLWTLDVFRSASQRLHDRFAADIALKHGDTSEFLGKERAVLAPTIPPEGRARGILTIAIGRLQHFAARHHRVEAFVQGARSPGIEGPSQTDKRGLVIGDRFIHHDPFFMRDRADFFVSLESSVGSNFPSNCRA
jgi:hypothetical protein